MNTTPLKANYPCDLHSHSNRSDGVYSPDQVIRLAAGLGIQYLLLCDHDITPPASIHTDEGESDICQYALQKGLRLIPGMEISCETEIEDVHLVCVGCSWDDPWFADFEARIQRSKAESYQKLVSRIREDGYPIHWTRLLTWNGKTITPDQLQKRMIFEALSEVGFAPTWAEAKKRVQSTPRYQILREKPPAAHIIRQIHRLGGLVILAHPFLIPEQVRQEENTLSREQFIESLIHAGLDAIEVRYPYHKTSYSGTKSDEEIARLVREKYTGRLSFLSGGSDFHGEKGKNGVSSRQLGECGLTTEEFQNAAPLLRIIRRLYPEDNLTG